MNEILLIMQHASIEVMNVLGFLLGGWDGFLYTLIYFMVVEYFTTAIVSILNKEFLKEFHLQGIARKLSIFILISMGYMIDVYVVQNENMIRTAVIFFYISKEGFSVLENIEMIGLPIPKKLKDILEYLKDNDK